MKESDRELTPPDLAGLLGDFDTDPCTEPGGSFIRAGTTYALAAGQDGLELPWPGSVFCNPPYSAPMPWVKRLAARAAPWCALVKLDTTTKWWEVLMSTAEGWGAFRKRIRFHHPGNVGRTTTAKFPNALVWGGGWCPGILLKGRLWL